MGLFTYTENIPFATNNPSVDQPNMETNTNSIFGLIGVDHIGFNVSTIGGYHNVIHFNDQGTSPSIPATPGIGQLYTFTTGGDQQLSYKSGAGVITQLTGAAGSNIIANGWTTLAGAAVLQWGSVSNPGSGPTDVTFPIAFPAGLVFSIQLTARNDGSHSAFTYYLDGAPSATKFTFRGSTSGSETLFWMAIGK